MHSHTLTVRLASESTNTWRRCQQASCATQATSTSSVHGARTPDLVYVACAQLVGSRSPASLEAPNSSSGSALQEALATPDPAPREPPSTRAEDSRGIATAGAATGSGGAGAERTPAVEAGATSRGGSGGVHEALRTPYVDLCELPWAGEEAERVHGGGADAPDTVRKTGSPHTQLLAAARYRSPGCLRLPSPLRPRPLLCQARA